ncbi:MAG: helix-turn-helix domain-containing protein [Cellulosilyticaceae bacterium]
MHFKRKELKMSKLDLIAKVGISKNTLTRYERGVTYPNQDTLNKIAAVLKIEPAELYDEYYIKS